jgi:hypothetical protein
MRGLNDLVLQERHYQFNDMMEDTSSRRWRGEKAIHYLANKIGVVALFSQWTQIMNNWVTMIAMGRVLDSVEAVMTGSTRHVDQKTARRLLAELGMTPEMIERLWNQQETGGLVQQNGLWLPNAGEWKLRDGRLDTELIDTFRSGLNREVRATVITPGLERPLFTDANLAMKLITQFQSFMWSSHAKIVVKGLQRTDYHNLEAFAVASALSVLAYYADMTARGRGEEAANADWETLADQIVARSPFLGAAAQFKRVGDQIPGVAPYINFSDQGTERRWASSLVGAVGGPTVGTAERIARVAQSASTPEGRARESFANDLRRLTPYNNIFYWRTLFDAASGR